MAETKEARLADLPRLVLDTFDAEHRLAVMELASDIVGGADHEDFAATFRAIAVRRLGLLVAMYGPPLDDFGDVEYDRALSDVMGAFGAR